jgi:hypothetical protein
MNVGYSNLEEGLKYGAKGTLGFVPEHLELIVAGVPIRIIEVGDCRLEAGVAQQGGFIFLHQL